MSFTAGPGTTYLLTSTQPLPSGTANGVLYLDGSKVVTSGSALTFASTVLSAPNVKIGLGAASQGSRLMVNTPNASAAGIQLFQDSQESWVMEIPASSTALRWTASGVEQMRLNSSGNLLLGSNTVGASAVPRFTALVNTGNFLIGAQGSTNGAIRAGIIHNITANLGGLVFATGGDNNTDATEKMRLDASGNLGLGVTPSAWFTSNNFRAIQLTNSASVHGQLAGGAFLTGISSNWFANAAGTDTYIANGFATTYRQLNGQHAWYTAPSGTAGNTISFTQAMTLDASGNLMVGTTSSLGRLTVVQDQDALTTIQINNASVGSNAGTRLTLGSQGGPSDIQSRRSGGATVITTAAVDRLTFDQSGNVVVGTAAIATNATDGFLYVPTCAGTPTGTPTTYTGRSPIVVNTTNNKLYFYSGGAWRDAGP